MISAGESWYNYAMTIKKPLSKPAADASEAVTAPAAGGAAIADRFKLDLQDANAKKGASGGVSAMIAGVFALVALAVAGLLTYKLYAHWEFLKGA